MGTPEADLTVAVGGRPVASTIGRLTAARPPSAVRSGGEVGSCPRLLPLAARPGPVKGRAARVE